MAGKVQMMCHYEVLELDRFTASIDDIKKQYKRMALKWHPDRNHGTEETATIRFKEVTAAYTVLSDPHEKKWYDDHREAIIRGSNGTRSNKDDTDVGDCIDLWRYFNATCFNGMSDATGGFFNVYSEIFSQLVQQENSVSEKMVDYPVFGTSTTSHADVAFFYNQWGNYTSIMTFAWEDEYNASEAPDRRVRREIEKLNKKERESGRRKYIDLVHQLVAYCRKRDPRWAEIEELAATKRSEEVARREKLRADELERRAIQKEKLVAKLNDPEEIARRAEELKGVYLLGDASSGDDSDEAWGDIGGKVRRRKRGKKGGKKGRGYAVMSDTDSDDNEADADVATLAGAASKLDLDAGVFVNVAKTSAANGSNAATTTAADEEEDEEEEDPEPHKCLVCNKSFKEEKQLIQHTNSKPHKQALKDAAKKEKKSGGGVSSNSTAKVSRSAGVATIDEEGSINLLAPKAPTNVYSHETFASTDHVHSFVERMLKKTSNDGLLVAETSGRKKDGGLENKEKAKSRGLSEKGSTFKLRGKKRDDE